MQGKLIVLEGLDGTGKSTQLELLKKEKAFEDFTFITFPNYESLSGKIISQYLAGMITEDNSFYSACSAGSFYAVDRYLSYKSDWEVKIKSGKNIIAARYVTSNAIYQMAKLTRDKWDGFLSWLYDFEHGRLGLPRADAVIYLNMPLEFSRKLLNERYSGADNNDIHETNALFMENCAHAAEFIAARDNWRKINCISNDKLRSREEIFAELCEIIKEVTNA